jgi:toxin ParE1/3/4
LKAARLREKARDDLRQQLAYYRREATQKVALQLRTVAESSIQFLEQNPGLGSPTLGRELDIDNLRTWRLTGFPLLWLYIEHPTHLDFVRLLGQQQDIAAIVDSEF